MVFQFCNQVVLPNLCHPRIHPYILGNRVDTGDKVNNRVDGKYSQLQVLSIAAKLADILAKLSILPNMIAVGERTGIVQNKVTTSNS